MQTFATTVYGERVELGIVLLRTYHVRAARFPDGRIIMSPIDVASTLGMRRNLTNHVNFIRIVDKSKKTPCMATADELRRCRFLAEKGYEDVMEWLNGDIEFISNQKFIEADQRKMRMIGEGNKTVRPEDTPSSPSPSPSQKGGCNPKRIDDDETLVERMIRLRSEAGIDMGIEGNEKSGSDEGSRNEKEKEKGKEKERRSWMEQDEEEEEEEEGPSMDHEGESTYKHEGSENEEGRQEYDKGSEREEAIASSRKRRRSDSYVKDDPSHSYEDRRLLKRENKLLKLENSRLQQALADCFKYIRNVKNGLNRVLSENDEMIAHKYITNDLEV